MLKILVYNSWLVFTKHRLLQDSWFRMKHRTRLEREQREDEEIKQMNKQTAEDRVRLSMIEAKLSNPPSGEDAEFEDLDALKGERDEILEKISQRESRISDINKRR